MPGTKSTNKATGSFDLRHSMQTYVTNFKVSVRFIKVTKSEIFNHPVSTYYLSLWPVILDNTAFNLSLNLAKMMMNERTRDPLSPKMQKNENKSFRRSDLSLSPPSGDARDASTS